MSLMNQWLQGVVEHSLQLNKHSDSDFPYEEVIKSDKQTSEVKLNPEKLMASARSLRAIINHPGDKVDEPHAGDLSIMDVLMYSLGCWICARKNSITRETNMNLCKTSSPTAFTMAKHFPSGENDKLLARSGAHRMLVIKLNI